MFSAVAPTVNKSQVTSHKSQVKRVYAHPAVLRDKEKKNSDALSSSPFMGSVTCDLRLATCDLLVGIREAIWTALAARSNAKRDYAKAEAEVAKCEKQLQLAVENEWVDEARTALLRRITWQDQAHHLKALVDKHTCQVVTLKTQLAFWENQMRASQVSTKRF